MTIAIVLASAIFGACIGSFLNVLILRLPRKKAMTGRSACMHCKHTLAPLDLVPVLSFIFLLGRCRYCKKPISPRYAIIESVTAFLFAVVVLLYSANSAFELINIFRMWFVISAAVVVFVIDLEHYLILDKVVYPVAAVLLVCNVVLQAFSGIPLWSLSSPVLGGILAAVMSGGIFFALWYFSKGTWMGLGDAKFMLVLGLATGWPLIWICLLLSFFAGTLVSIPLLLSGKAGLTTKIPFGTFLAVSLVVTVLFGQDILNWYRSLTGLFY